MAAHQCASALILWTILSYGESLMNTNTIRYLLTVPEAAARLGLRESTIRAWVLARRIGRVRIGRRAIRIPAEEVERLIREGGEPAQRQVKGSEKR